MYNQGMDDSIMNIGDDEYGVPDSINVVLLNILLETDADLAKYYLGAHWSLANKSNPERYAHAAHSLRELIQGLPYKHPRAVLIERPESITSDGSNLYKTRDSWAKLIVDKEDPGIWTVEPSQTTSKYLRDSQKFWEFIQKNYPTRKEARLKMVEAIHDGNTLPEKLHAKQIKMWGKYYGSFANIAHHGATLIPEEFDSKLKEFESYLIRQLAPETTKEMARVDQIVDEFELEGVDENIPELLLLIKSLRSNYDRFFYKISSVSWLDILKQNDLDKLIEEPVISEGKIRTPSWVPGQYYAKVAKSEPEKVLEIIRSLISTKNGIVHQQVVEIAKCLPAEYLDGINLAIEKWLRNEYNTNSLLPFKVGEYIVVLAKRSASKKALDIFSVLFELIPPEENDTPYYNRDPQSLTSNTSYRTILDDTVPILKELNSKRLLKILCEKLESGMIIKKESAVEREGVIEDFSEISRPDVNHYDHDFKPIQALISTIVNLLKSKFKTSQEKLFAAELLRSYKYKIFYRIAANLLENDTSIECIKVYEEIVGKIGKPNHEDFISQEVNVVSAVSLEKMKTYEVTELVKLLNEWDPKEEFPGFGRARDDLGRTLSQYIQEDPNLIARIEPEFKNIKIDYIGHVFSGIRFASDNKTGEIDWEVVFRLGKDIISRTNTNSSEGLERQAQFDLVNSLQSGINQDHIKISNQDVVAKVLDIILPLTNHVEPTKEYEDESSKNDSGWDALTLSINTMRGEALETLIAVLKNASRQTKNILSDAMSQQQADVIYETLERHLDLNLEKTLAVRTVFAREFSSLVFVNREWAVSVVDKIFPEEQDKREYFVSAIEIFINYSKFYPEFFKLIENKVKLYMEILKTKAEDEDEEKINHLVGRVLLLYIDDLIDLSHPLMQLLLTMPDRYLEEALDFLVRGCKQTTGDRNSLLIKKSIEYWDHRLSNQDVKEAEYSKIGLWLAWGGFEEEWIASHFLDALSHVTNMDNLYYVTDHIIALHDVDESHASVYFRRLAETQTKDNLISMLHDPQLQPALKKLLGSSDESVADNVRKGIDRLCEYGFYDFANLLN